MGEVMDFKIEEETNEQSQQSIKDRAGFELLRVGLKALSQRAVIAASSLFTLLTVASAFWLYMSIHEPNTMQLIQIGMYSLFVLAANLIVKRI